MKRFFAILFVIILLITVVSISFAESNINQLYGVWYLEEASTKKVLFISKDVITLQTFNTTYYSGYLYNFINKIYEDATNANLFYILSADGLLYKLVLNEDGSTLTCGKTDTAESNMLTYIKK